MERILGRKLQKKEEVDHIYGNKLDNRREHLRLATRKQNAQNKHTLGKYRGTTWDKSRKKWAARVGHNRRVLNLGRFDTRQEAALVSENKRVELGFFSKV